MRTTHYVALAVALLKKTILFAILIYFKLSIGLLFFFICNIIDVTYILIIHS